MKSELLGGGQSYNRIGFSVHCKLEDIRSGIVSGYIEHPL
jgi:hypothetical protein